MAHKRHNRDPVYKADWLSQFSERPTSLSNDYEVTDITGTLPPQLIGTFWRNGPGTFNRTKTSVSVDGDGMLSRLTFTGSRVYFRNRFVRTTGYVEEQEAGKPLHRGPFGTVPDDWWLRGFGATTVPFKNTANTSQLMLNNNQFLLFWEGGLPHSINPRTMETIGETRMNNILEKGRAFSAHPVMDGNTMINFGITFGKNTTLTVWEIDTDGVGSAQPHNHQLLQKHGVRLRSLGASIHSCSVTKNWVRLWVWWQNQNQNQNRGCAFCVGLTLFFFVPPLL